ncbi:hypothetical protein DL98DRAFT_594400 [Cadophora sp. DSE1049]|nr:hypothetical protein DL98DRAFT_594400 [Cadophora sp. DSE1049]
MIQSFLSIPRPTAREDRSRLILWSPEKTKTLPPLREGDRTVVKLVAVTSEGEKTTYYYPQNIIYRSDKPTWIVFPIPSKPEAETAFEFKLKYDCESPEDKVWDGKFTKTDAVVNVFCVIHNTMSRVEVWEDTLATALSFLNKRKEAAAEKEGRKARLGWIFGRKGKGRGVNDVLGSYNSVARLKGKGTWIQSLPFAFQGDPYHGLLPSALPSRVAKREPEPIPIDIGCDIHKTPLVATIWEDLEMAKKKDKEREEELVKKQVGMNKVEAEARKTKKEPKYGETVDGRVVVIRDKGELVLSTYKVEWDKGENWWL